jgi:predicted lipid-binding transport protein (Tim44 family)
MNAPRTTTPAAPPEVQRMRRRFASLMVTQGVLAAAAIAGLVAYFAFHLPWGLPAFAVFLALAVVAQVRFILMFRNSQG